MTSDLKIHLSTLLNETIGKVQSVTGGDISKAYKIDTPNNSYFLKLNSESSALQMFQTEANGLQSIRNTNTIKTPKVFACDTFENMPFLLLEFIERKSPSPNDFETLGYQLAKLHLCTSNAFGLAQDNFIGSLSQSNTQCSNWLDFYTKARLWPQLKLAKQKHLLTDKECPSEPQILENLKPLFKNIKPSLLHGDLWNGNYLISNDDIPYLIDPAVYYGHHEVDMAMTKLFGGFGEAFYDTYFSIIPQDDYTSIRIEIYQLYYLLVHLNLFGPSYHQSVISILKKYF
ncbi:fructosamine kinase family protein [Aestuariivivens insulae]|uniref:fructosamine kinase family protein n=1 Tax=Aestuariivivens insulae TaxID=1621988 RepID=UPI001F576076|nr:fructosamine kinase family protein [Aestuariivivens insulae]